MSNSSLKKKLYPLFLWYLRTAARMKLNKLKPQIVGVTGSVGKSSFVSLLRIALGDDYHIQAATNANSETGLPLAVLNLRDKLTGFDSKAWSKVLSAVPGALLSGKNRYNLIIAEMAIDSPSWPRNMEYLLKIIHPHIGVWLNVGYVHAQDFAPLLPPNKQNDSQAVLDLIAKEKVKMLEALKPDEYAVVNDDDKSINLLKRRIKSHLLTVGHQSYNDLKIVHSHCDLNGSTFTFQKGPQTYTLQFKKQVLMNEYETILASVLTTAELLNVPLETAIKRLEENLVLPNGRFNILPGQKDITIIDSSYNSSPASLKAALGFLRSTNPYGDRVAILGDMRELGPLTIQAHTEIADDIKKSCDFVVLVGPLMRQYTLPALKVLNFPSQKLFVFETAQGVAATLLPSLQSKDVILVKGSQNGIFLEVVVRDLLSKNVDASKVLCRTGASWDTIRNKYFMEHPSKHYAIK